MLKFISLLSLVGVALAAGIGDGGHTFDVTTSRPGITDSGLLDCTVLENGSHNVHPYDCSRFIQCDNGRAQDMPCAACGTDPQCLGREWLEFDGSAPSCVWPKYSTCSNGGGTTPQVTNPPPTNPPPTNPPPTNPPPTNPPPTNPPPTTPPSTNPPPTNPPPTNPPPQGTWCNATDCEVNITCDDFTYCKRIDTTENPALVDDGELVTVTCNRPLTWPVGITTDNSGGDFVVGACLGWDDIPADRQKDILEQCLTPECVLRAVPDDGTCTNQFQYRPKDGDFSSITSCPVGTRVDVEQRRCLAPAC